jgi:hypothetical protein
VKKLLGSGSLVQVVKSNLTTSGTTQTTGAIATTAGNTLLFFAAYKAVNAGVVTPSDSTGLTWTRVPNAPFAGSASGLNLDCWQAVNITGNAANTFTFATTGADTPTIFVAEFSGRSKINPFDVSNTASDTTATSGTHTTGTFHPGAANDDVIAFNVSSTLAQTYTAGGSWVIPTNGSVTTATGYDAFVQTQNNVPHAAINNVYAVSLNDKLDAFIVGLQIPTQPYSDEWLDYFQEVPEVYETRTTYIQIDLQPQIADIDFDWTDDAGETDAWLLQESSSGVVVANVVTAPTLQYYGEDAELYDEAIETQQFSSSYQQLDRFPLLCIEDPWDWFQEIDDDEWMLRDTDILIGSIGAQPPAEFESAYDWDEDPDEFFPDDFGNDDAPALVEDAWDWATNADDDEQIIIDEVQGINAPAPSPFALEDAFDWFPPEEDDYLVVDDWLEFDNNPVITIEDPSWWDEEPDQIDGTTTDLDAVGPDNNPVITVEDPWDWFVTDDDDYFIVDEYALVTVVPNPAITVEDPFDQFTTDDDDYFIVDEYPLITVPPNPLLNAEDRFDHFTTDDDDWWIPDEVQIIDTAQSTQYPVDDAWDWSNTDDDDYFVDDGFASLDNTPLVAEDPWEYFTTDPDDELYLSLDTDPVPVQIALIEDTWDHFTQDADDEEWAFRDMDAVQPLQALSSQTDGWDHFFGEDDDYYVSDDYSIIDMVAAPSQPVEDAWNWWDDDSQENDFEEQFPPKILDPSVYETNPAFVVYLKFRPFIVVWTPKVET